LSDFDGLSALGTWTLFIEDDFPLDALRFRSFTLDIATERIVEEQVEEEVEEETVPTDGNGRIPEPAGLGLFGLAVLGLVRRFRRRRAA
ncbi:MAG: PEP-CTERM sorting domain-containing protein, partial [Planctomycetota bacterium]